MAGDSPGANRLQKEREARRRAKFDKHTTDHIYKSADVSTVSNNAGDSRGRPGAPLKGIPNRVTKLDERNADKKYYAADPQAPTAQQIAHAKSKGLPVPTGLPEPAIRTYGVGASRPVSPTDAKAVIRTVNEVNDVLDDAAGRLVEGVPFVIEVPNGSTEVLRRARAKLDSLVTREVISEDLAREVRFSRVDMTAETVPAHKIAALPPPAPRNDETVSVDDAQAEDALLAPGALIGGGMDFDDEVDVTAEAPIEAEVTDVPEDDANDDDTDDANNFLDPAVESAAVSSELTGPTLDEEPATEEAAVSEEPAAEVAADTTVASDEAAEPTDAPASEEPAPTRPARTGRRSGRGSK